MAVIAAAAGAIIALPTFPDAVAQENGATSLAQAKLYEQACRRVVEPQVFAPYERTEVQCYFASTGCDGWSASIAEGDADERCAVRVYLRNDGIVAFTRLYLAEADDSYQIDQHCYRPDGSLAAFEAEVSRGEASSLHERRYYDGIGTELGRSRASFDSDTGERIADAEAGALLLEPYLWAEAAELEISAAPSGAGPEFSAPPAHASNAAREMIAERALEVLELLKNKNLHALSDYVHLIYGVRFSPEGVVDLARDAVLLPRELRNINARGSRQPWPSAQGGSDIVVEFDFDTYYARHVYDRDYLHAPQVGYNCPVTGAAEDDNLREVYDEAIIVEYRFPDYTERQGSAGWASLRLVFSDYLGNWYLRGIVHGTPALDGT